MSFFGLHLSSAIFWHPVHCCIGGSFSLQSEDVASHFPSPCCNNVLGVAPCLPSSSPLHVWHGRAMRCRGLYTCSGDGRHLVGISLYAVLFLKRWHLIKRWRFQMTTDITPPWILAECGVPSLVSNKWSQNNSIKTFI